MQTIAALILIFDFSANSDLSSWNIVNDVVMGGRSNSNIELTDDGHARFHGHVSLENNGGFASVRHNMDPKSVEGYKKVVLRCKGDGKRYQFRIKKSNEDYYSYINYFQTGTDWQEIELSLKDFYPSFRGRELDLPKFNADQIDELSILIANYKEQDFSLLIDKIYLR